MAALSLLAITSASFVAITATVQSRQVTVYEDGQVATAAYLMQDHNGNPAAGINRPAGAKTIFYPTEGDYFVAGQLIGYLKSTGANMTFDIVEGGE